MLGREAFWPAIGQSCARVADLESVDSNRGTKLGGIIACLGVATLAGCAGSGGGGAGAPNQAPFPTTLGEDGGQAAAPIATGQTAAMIVTELSNVSPFILRATIPIPPNTFPRSDGKLLFTINDYDGAPVVTQTEVVTNYPQYSQGADVVEVIAKVRRNPLLSPGDFTEYEVVVAPQAAVPDPGTPGVEDLSALVPLPQDTLDLLADPQAIEIATYDCFGNKYVSYPLDGSGTYTLLSFGNVQSKLKVYQTMTPVTPVSGASGTLPHFFGVHAYLTTQQDDGILGIDLRFNNGHSGNDTGTDLDDPLGKVYFERIDITVPSDWYVDQAYEDPNFGAESTVSGRRTVSIVNPQSGGKLHVMQWMAQMHRRLILSTATERSSALKYVQLGAGQGFNTRSFDAGTELYSWWNRGTSRYFPQNYQLPLLDHVGLSTVRNGERDNHDDFESYLNGGSNTGNYPVPSSTLGWAHPYGVSYGGMTGGSEIFIYDGVATAFSGSRLGTQAFKGLHRMHSDRMPTALYNIDGSPSSVETWKTMSSSGAYVPFESFNGPNLNTGDPFGVGNVDPFQVDYVASAGLAPGYESALLNFDAHDYQHFTRYTRGPKVLLWLANDAIAKDDLLMQAENFNLAYHTLNNASGGGVQGTGMKSDQMFVAGNGGKSFHFGRGEAWGFDCAAVAYTFADKAWRDTKKPWFEDMLTMVAAGQGSCNGFIQGIVNVKNLGGLYRTRQQIEQSITESMLQSVRESVFRNADLAHSDLARDILRQTLYGFVSDMVFQPGFAVPRSQTAIGPMSVNSPIYCALGQVPSGGFSKYNEAYQDWCSFAWGFEITGDVKFLDRAEGQFAGGLLLSRLKTDGLKNLENRSAIIALAQRLGGEL